MPRLLKAGGAHEDQARNQFRGGTEASSRPVGSLTFALPKLVIPLCRVAREGLSIESPFPRVGLDCVTGPASRGGLHGRLRLAPPPISPPERKPLAQRKRPSATRLNSGKLDVRFCQMVSSDIHQDGQ